MESQVESQVKERVEERVETQVEISFKQACIEAYAGSKKKLPFAKKYYCHNCHSDFFDNPLLPEKMMISCPYCFVTHYGE